MGVYTQYSECADLCPTARRMGACLASGFADPVASLSAPSLTSSVFTRVDLVFPPGPKTFANYGWSIPHEAIRHEMMRIEYATSRMSGSDASFGKFREYFDSYVAFYLEFHHSAEDEVLFVAVAEKVALPPSIAVDHEALDHAKIDAVRKACDAKDLAQLQTAVQDLSTFCKRHMEDEERLLLPQINETFDLAWFGGLMGKFGPWAGVLLGVLAW